MIDRSIYWHFCSHLQSLSLSLSLSLSHASGSRFSLIMLHVPSSPSSSFMLQVHLPHGVGQNNVDSVCQGTKLLWNGKPSLSSHYNNILFVCKEVRSLSQQIMFFYEIQNLSIKELERTLHLIHSYTHLDPASASLFSWNIPCLFCNDNKIILINKPEYLLIYWHLWKALLSPRIPYSVNLWHCT